MISDEENESMCEYANVRYSSVLNNRRGQNKWGCLENCPILIKRVCFEEMVGMNDGFVRGVKLL